MGGGRGSVSAGHVQGDNVACVTRASEAGFSSFVGHRVAMRAAACIRIKKKNARGPHGPQEMVRGGREGGWVGGRRGQWDTRFFAGSVHGSQLSSVETQSRF